MDKEARNLAKRIKGVGGTVRLSRNGHLLVGGPKGRTTVVSKIPTDRHLRNALTHLRRVGLPLR